MNHERPIVDLLEGVPHPANAHPLVGHRDCITRLLSQHYADRLPQGVILSGLKGIGKSTLAFRFAAHILRNAEGSYADIGQGEIPVVDDTVQSKISAGSHPNLLHLTRPWDPSTKKFKTQLTVEEVRRAVQFFATARGEAGWRIAILDAVDDMNRSASNAILKLLEEPPEKTLFLLIAHSSASVLPTIRSRCQHLALKPLEKNDLETVLRNLAIGDDIAGMDPDLLVHLSRGSVRRAIVLAREDGITLYQRFMKIVSDLENPDWEGIHELSERVAGRGLEEQYSLLLEFAFLHIEKMATRHEEVSISTLARWAQLWEKTRNSVRLSNAYNLDRKQVILNLFRDMGDAAGA